MVSMMLHMVSQYLKERRIWKECGKPIRPESERERIVEICHHCHSFENDVCRKCGCPVGLDSEKILWATTRCPSSARKWNVWEPIQQKAMEVRARYAPQFTRRIEPNQETVKHLKPPKPRKKKGCKGCR